MFNYYLSVSCCTPNELKNINKAILEIKKLVPHKFSLSKYYLTEIEIKKKFTELLTVCVDMELDIEPVTMLSILKNIEKKLDKKSKILTLVDIDIVWVKGTKIKSANLEIPHPRAFKRAHVLYPIKELVKSDRELLSLIDLNISRVKKENIAKLSDFHLKKKYGN